MFRSKMLMPSIWLAIALITISNSVIAADVPIGLIKKVTGTVHIARGSTIVSAHVGSSVMAEDRVVTGTNSSVGLTLKDDTLLSAGPSSVLALNRFTFNSTTNDGSISLQLFKGTLRAITGLIAQQSPAAVEMKTRTATIGIRGTDFIVEVSEND